MTPRASNGGRAQSGHCELRGPKRPEMSEPIPLRQLESGQSGVVVKVRTGGELGRRLREMGLVTGTPVRMIGRAPLKDPVEIKIRGYNLTLWNNEADLIWVETEEHP